VDEDGGALHRLHQRRVHRVLEQDRQRPRDAQVITRDGTAVLVCSKHNVAQSALEVVGVGCKGKDGHELRRNRNVELCLARAVLLFFSLADRDLAQHAIVRVNHTAPRDRLVVNVQPRKPTTVRAVKACVRESASV
jgi:hypothetical protein